MRGKRYSVGDRSINSQTPSPSERATIRFENRAGERPKPCGENRLPPEGCRPPGISDSCRLTLPFSEVDMHDPRLPNPSLSTLTMVARLVLIDHAR
jgi:hypothetical protein